MRYGRSGKSNENIGVGNFSLPEQAYDTSSTNQTLQAAQTSVVRQSIISELRFQYERLNRQSTTDTVLPTIHVSEAFVGGGSSVGAASFTENRWELSENITYAPDLHTVRFGVRMRGVSLNDISDPNFNGTFIFTGGLAPRLENGEIVIGTDGQPIIDNVTSIERYRRTVFFRQQGLSPADIRLRGGGASQFSINGGDMQTRINQINVSGYVQDDWRITSNFGLSLGLRFETQTNITRNFDLAPRVAFAWSRQTGKDKKLATVVRGGFGVFYIRFGEGLVLDTEKFNGNGIERYIVTSADILDSFAGTPTAQDLAGIGLPLTLRRIASDLQAPYSFHSALSIEQQLPFKSVFTVTYSDLRVRDAFRSRNINAPSFGTRPFPESGDIYQFESNGRFDSRRLSLTFSTRFWRFSNLFLKYDLSSSKSDTEGASYFPVNQFDFSNEYGRSSLDARHNLVLSASLGVPFGIRLSPLIIAVSGRPFNITTGQDSNEDSLFNERPAFATDLNRGSVVRTRFGNFDLSPATGSEIIPRNFGQGTSFFAVSLRASKNFSFNLGSVTPNVQGTPPAAKRFGLNLSVQFWNLLNRPNLNLPIGNLTSPFFGRATSLAGTFGTGDPLSGSRTIELQVRFSF